MIPPLFEKRMKKLGVKGAVKDIPTQFCLGSGHMLFWMNKGKYLKQRYMELTTEMLSRGFSPDLGLDYELSKEAASVSMEWTPAAGDYRLILSRIAEKLELRGPWYRFHGMRVDDVDEFIKKVCSRVGVDLRRTESYPHLELKRIL